MTALPPRTVVALDGVDLEIKQGEILGLLVPNGAGKTTLIKILCGLLTPASGSGAVAGYDLLRQRDQVNRSIFYVSTTGWVGLEWALTVEENLLLYARRWLERRLVGARTICRPRVVHTMRERRRA